MLEDIGGLLKYFLQVFFFPLILRFFICDVSITLRECIVITIYMEDQEGLKKYVCLWVSLDLSINLKYI